MGPLRQSDSLRECDFLDSQHQKATSVICAFVMAWRVSVPGSTARTNAVSSLTHASQ